MVTKPWYQTHQMFNYQIQYKMYFTFDSLQLNNILIHVGHDVFSSIYKTLLWRKVTITFKLNTYRSFPDSWLIIGFVTRLTRLVPLVEQELPGNMGSTSVFSWGRVIEIYIDLIEPLTLACNNWCFMNGDILFLQHQYSRQVQQVLLYKSLTNQETLYFTVTSVFYCHFISFHCLIKQKLIIKVTHFNTSSLRVQIQQISI